MVAMEESERIEADTIPKAKHLCVFIHGLWGNPGHLQNLSEALEKQYGKDELCILVASQNSDFYTYDGIDVGAERCAKEVEDELERLHKEGYKIEKFSMIGYSLGGLFARYCIGLLEKRLELRNLELVNFITFASPHLGVRTPLRGYHSSVWNALGGRTLSTSGRQLFLIDSFRDTGRPLLSVLADPESIFIKALSKFKNRALYANVVNDRSAPWYTTGISRTDPFENVDELDIKYLPKYAPVILDNSQPITLAKKEEETLYARVSKSTSTFLNRLPFLAIFTLIAPIGTTAFLINSGIQTIRSGQRLKLHEEGKAGAFSQYRIPFMLEAHNAVDGVFESMNAAEAPEYLSDSSEGSTNTGGGNTPSSDRDPGEKAIHTIKKHEFPVLALSDEQFTMIDSLDAVGFKKYPVHIHNDRHSHAAIIVRKNKPTFDEGHVVIRHWLEEVFQL